VSQGLSPTGKEWFEVAGETIEIRGVGICWGVGVGARERYRASLVDLGDQALWEEPVRFGDGGGSYVGEGGSYAWGKAVGAGLDLAVKKGLEAQGRDNRAFIRLFPSLATSVAEAPFVLFFCLPGPEPVACA